jgi:hypothetical protein
MTINTKQSPTDAIVGIDYALRSEIFTETFYTSGLVEIALADLKVWKPIYFTPGSAVLTQNVNNPFQGRIVESKFEARIPGKTPEMTRTLEDLCGRFVVLKLTLESGQAIICGGKTRKLRISYSGSSGTQNGYTLMFEYRSRTDFYYLKDSEASGN